MPSQYMSKYAIIVPFIDGISKFDILGILNVVVAACDRGRGDHGGTMCVPDRSSPLILNVLQRTIFNTSHVTMRDNVIYVQSISSEKPHNRFVEKISCKTPLILEMTDFPRFLSGNLPGCKVIPHKKLFNAREIRGQNARSISP
jgi:hypothetical protein